MVVPGVLVKKKKKKKKGQPELATLVSPGTGRDEKGTPISAPSIHIGALVRAGSLWPLNPKMEDHTLVIVAILKP
jgi:hypothetical protein